MAGFVRKFTKGLFIGLNLVAVFLFLLGCLVPYLNPTRWWLFGFIALLIPYLAVILLFAVIFWLIAKPRVAIISLATLLIGWKPLTAIVGFHIKESFSPVKIEPRLRLVDWNVGSLVGLSKSRDKQKLVRERIADAIDNTNADVVCLQEFNHSDTQGPQADNIGLFKKHFPYYFFSKDYSKGNGFYMYGSIIFSKYPIIKTGRVQYPGNRAESLIYADIIKANDTIRIYTSHLQSFKFSESDYLDIEKIKQQDKELVDASKNVFKKMRVAFSRRGIQANIVREALDSCPYPSVMCGDFNDVPASYTYFRIRGNRQDAFLEKGFGIGRSYMALAPTLRIDYIMPDQQFIVHQFDMVDEDLSDHFMLVADISLKGK